MGSNTDDDAQPILAASALLKRGGLVAFPTETVYGLGADAENVSAVARIFQVKARPSENPLIVHLARASALENWARELPAAAFRLAEAFWPGPLTLIVKRADRVPNLVTANQDTVGLRVPNHPVALALLEEFGGGIAAPSANRFGRVSPTTAQDVRDELGDKVDMILDGGACDVGLESTIVDLSGSVARVLRAGAITRESLEAVLGYPVPRLEQSQVLHPGQHPSHYAPRARVVLTSVERIHLELRPLILEGLKIGVMGSPAQMVDLPAQVTRLTLPDTLEAVARVLYRELRAADRAQLDVVVIVPPPKTGLGEAIVERLERAAGPRPEPAEN